MLFNFLVFRNKIISSQSAPNQQLKTQAMPQSAVFKTGFPGILLNLSKQLFWTKAKQILSLKQYFCWLFQYSFFSRWIKLRSAMVPHTALLEPISECMLSGGLAALSSYILFRTDPICFYLVHILVWFICDWILIHIVQVKITA